MFRAGIYLFIAIVTTLLTGCATPIRPAIMESHDPVHKYNKNYTLNQKQRVYVGESVIRIQDYYVESVNIPLVEPTDNFSVQSGLLTMDYVKGQKYSVSGTFDSNGSSLLVIPSDKHSISWSKPAILIDKDGTILHAVQTGPEGALKTPTFNLAPTTARMVRISEEKVLVSKGYENYEILFNGMDKNTMTFTYREFSPDGLARVAFYQTLTYDAKATTIRFKKFKISVLDANSEGITYAVVEDAN